MKEKEKEKEKGGGKAYQKEVSPVYNTNNKRSLAQTSNKVGLMTAESSNVVEFLQEVVSYDNSLFTNAHDLVSLSPAADGRGLESSRHWNFKHTTNPDGSVSFFRDANVVNNVETTLRKPSTRGLIHEIVLDTSFYTNNNTKDVFSVVLIDELDGKETKVVENVSLLGDSIKKIKLTTPVAASRVKLQVNEGGLARFRVLGTPLPPLPTLTNVLKGAKVLWASDASYGSPDLVLRDEREGKIMAGWESKRHSARHAIVVALSQPAVATKVLVDTYMHCLNAFQFISILAGNFSAGTSEEIVAALPKWKLEFNDGKTETVADADLNKFFESNSVPNVHYQQVVTAEGPWKVLLPASQLRRDTLHEYAAAQLKEAGTFTHLAFVGIPDGGIHRLVVFGSHV